MRYYTLSGDYNRKNTPEPSARRLMELFLKDGMDVKMEYTHTMDERPLYRKPTEEEILSGQYKPSDFVLTKASDGIM